MVNALKQCLTRPRKLGSALAPSAGSLTVSPGLEFTHQPGSKSPLSSVRPIVSPGSGTVRQSGDVLAHSPGGLALSLSLDTIESVGRTQTNRCRTIGRKL